MVQARLRLRVMDFALKHQLLKRGLFVNDLQIYGKKLLSYLLNQIVPQNQIQAGAERIQSSQGISRDTLARLWRIDPFFLFLRDKFSLQPGKREFDCTVLPAECKQAS
jgi:hypothetical protein